MNGINIQPTKIPKFVNTAREIAEENYANNFAQILYERIKDYEANLSEDFEVGVRLVNFGQTLTFPVHSIGYKNPSIIIFYGKTEDDTPIELIQHVSQLSFLLTSLPRENKDIPKQPVGFRY